MKIFIDSANVDQIKKWIDCGIVDGVTTNPTHLSKEGSNTKQVLLDICRIVQGPVSIEVVEKKPEDVYKQAKKISKLAENVVVKIPCVVEYFPVIKKLAKENVKINMTLVFSEVQAIFAAKLGVKYISPFVGRWDDIGKDGTKLIEEIVQIKNNFKFKSEILAASIRTVQQWKIIALAGADVITVPPSVLEQATKHPLTDIGVKLFDNDWKKLNKASLL